MPSTVTNEKQSTSSRLWRLSSSVVINDNEIVSDDLQTKGSKKKKKPCLSSLASATFLTADSLVGSPLADVRHLLGDYWAVMASPAWRNHHTETRIEVALISF